MSDKNKTSNAFIWGLIVGGLAALFLAPFSGRKMRRMSKEKGKEAMDKAKIKYSEMEPKINEAKTESKRWWEKAMNGTSNTKNEVASKVEEAGDKIEEKTDELSEE